MATTANPQTELKYQVVAVEASIGDREMEAIVGMDSAYKVAMFEKEKVGNMYVSSALVCDMYERIAELEAELEGLKKQEPYCYMDEYGNVEPEMKPWMVDEDNIDSAIWFPVYAQPVQPAVPDGWQLVPKEPTEEMLDEARYSRDCPVSGSDKSRDIYIAMLSAAPKENT